MADATTRVFLVCSGLGRVCRGFESFTQECFAALQHEPALAVELFKGGGQPEPHSTPLWTVPRQSAAAIRMGAWLQRDPYFVEQASFVLSLLPHIQRSRPDVIFFSDGVIGNLLWHWRRLTGQRYRLLLSNGGPSYPPYMPRCDHIQQVAPPHFEGAVAGGIPSDQQSIVPYGIELTPNLSLLDPSARNALRQHLGLPSDRPIVLSVGAINTTHKRMDYVIQEVANLPEPRPYLLLLGQQEADTPALIALGNQRLGADHFQVKTVPNEAIAHYYQAADLFVLASLSEGFGRVFLEAMSYGLPCLAHDYDITRFVLGDAGILGDLTLPGRLSGLIARALEGSDSPTRRSQRHRQVYDRFSWSTLRPRYVEMIQRCALGKEGVRSPIALSGCLDR